MTKKLQIELPDDIHVAMLVLSHVMRQSPGEMAAEWVTMAVTAITGKPLQLAKSMSMGSPLGTPLGEQPGKQSGMATGIGPYDMPPTRGGKRSQAKDAVPVPVPSPNDEAAKAIYQLKITLRESKPPIWRRIQVPGSITLIKLHRVLQVVMGWEDYHLHQYIVDGVFYGTRDPDFEAIGTEAANERGVKLYQIAPDAGARFIYEYDFGDGWQHQVVVEKLLPAGPGATYPVCIAGKRACPPEDVGGIWSYDDFLDVIRNPSHPEHDELLEWAGRDFDPEKFDLDAVNSALKQVR
jgi:hypothetical protein